MKIVSIVGAGPQFIKAAMISRLLRAEWVETVKMGWNILVDADIERILDAVATFKPPATRPPLYGDGQAAARCVALLNSEK